MRGSRRRDDISRSPLCASLVLLFSCIPTEALQPTPPHPVNGFCEGVDYLPNGGSPHTTGFFMIGGLLAVCMIVACGIIKAIRCPDTAGQAGIHRVYHSLPTGGLLSILFRAFFYVKLIGSVGVMLGVAQQQHDPTSPRSPSPSALPNTTDGDVWDTATRCCNALDDHGFAYRVFSAHPFYFLGVVSDADQADTAASRLNALRANWTHPAGQPPNDTQLGWSPTEAPTALLGAAVGVMGFFLLLCLVTALMAHGCRRPTLAGQQDTTASPTIRYEASPRAAPALPPLKREGSGGSQEELQVTMHQSPQGSQSGVGGLGLLSKPFSDGAAGEDAAPSTVAESGDGGCAACIPLPRRRALLRVCVASAFLTLEALCGYLVFYATALLCEGGPGGAVFLAVVSLLLAGAMLLWISVASKVSPAAAAVQCARKGSQVVLRAAYGRRGVLLLLHAVVLGAGLGWAAHRRAATDAAVQGGGSPTLHAAVTAAGLAAGLMLLPCISLHILLLPPREGGEARRESGGRSAAAAAAEPPQRAEVEAGGAQRPEEEEEEGGVEREKEADEVEGGLRRGGSGPLPIPRYGRGGGSSSCGDAVAPHGGGGGGVAESPRGGAGRCGALAPAALEWMWLTAKPPSGRGWDLTRLFDLALLVMDGVVVGLVVDAVAQAGVGPGGGDAAQLLGRAADAVTALLAITFCWVVAVLCVSVCAAVAARRLAQGSTSPRLVPDTAASQQTSNVLDPLCARPAPLSVASEGAGSDIAEPLLGLTPKERSSSAAISRLKASFPNSSILDDDGTNELQNMLEYSSAKIQLSATEQRVARLQAELEEKDEMIAQQQQKLRGLTSGIRARTEEAAFYKSINKKNHSLVSFVPSDKEIEV